MQIAAMLPSGPRVLLIHLAQMGGAIPLQLRTFLMDPKYRKAGRMVGGDVAKIREDYGVQATGVLELGSSCRQRGLVDDGYVGVLHVYELVYTWIWVTIFSNAGLVWFRLAGSL